MLIQNLNTNSSNSRLVTIEQGKSTENQYKSKEMIRSASGKKLQNNFGIGNDQKQHKILFNAIDSNNGSKANTMMGSSAKGNVPTGKITKSSSQPRIRTIKQQILRIPKVKQILQKDKFIYQSDIQKRLQLIGDVKNQNFTPGQVLDLKTLQQPLTLPLKKKRRHKTNYKIPLTRPNINHLNQLIYQHIDHNQFYKNEEFIYLSEKDYKEPFDLKKLKFMDEINPLKKMYKQKFPELKEGVLAKNKLLLQHVILSRNVKREMKLDQKKRKKQEDLKGNSTPGNAMGRAQTVKISVGML